MNNKTLAIISYITLIGWLVSYFSYKGRDEKNQLVSYHLEQSLGLFIIWVLFSVAAAILAGIIPGLGILVSVIGIIQLLLIIAGIVNAASEVCKPLPLTGKFFEKKFSFLS